MREYQTVDDFACSAADYLRLLLSSEYERHSLVKQGKKDIFVSDWEVCPGGPQPFRRTSAYISPPNIPGVFAALFGNVEPRVAEKHWVGLREDGTVVLNMEMRLSGMPFASVFDISSRWTVVDVAPGTCRLTIDARVAFEKWGLQGMVEGMLCEEGDIARKHHNACGGDFLAKHRGTVDVSKTRAIFEHFGQAPVAAAAAADEDADADADAETDADDTLGDMSMSTFVEGSPNDMSVATIVVDDDTDAVVVSAERKAEPEKIEVVAPSGAAVSRTVTAIRTDESELQLRPHEQHHERRAIIRNPPPTPNYVRLLAIAVLAFEAVGFFRHAANARIAGTALLVLAMTRR